MSVPADDTGTARPGGVRVRRRRRRTAATIVIAIALVIAAAAVWALATREADPEPQAGAPPNVAPVVLTDLVDETTYDATLGRTEPAEITAGRAGVLTGVAERGVSVASGEELFSLDGRAVPLLIGDSPAFRDLHLGDSTVAVPASRAGTLTWLPDEGTVVESGDVIARIDDEPLVALEGTIPMFRELRSGVEGEDVAQLESALVELGYDPDGDVTVDEEYTSVTADLVERWQEDLGVSETGRVGPDLVVFTPLPGQVLRHESPVGAAITPGSPLILASGGDPIDGVDVAQLEASLSDLGYGSLRVDGVYDESTAAAVAEWVSALGLEPAGWLPLGSFVFNPSPGRVNSHLAKIGAPLSPGAPVLTVASDQPVVRLDLPAEDQGVLAVGDEVTVILPDREEVAATVSSVSAVAETDSQTGQATFEVEVAVDDPEAVAALDEAPVDVRVVSDAVEGVKAVPVSALLALAEGGYAVEVMDGGETRLVAVEPGFFGDGLVEITGEVEPGAEVVVP